MANFDRVIALDVGRITAHGVAFPVLGLPPIGQGARTAKIKQAPLRQIDVKRCVAGVLAAGIQPEEITITKSGDVRIRCNGAVGVAETTEKLGEIDQGQAELEAWVRSRAS